MKLRYRIGTRIIYWTWRLLFGLKIEGRENIPKNGGVIIASNHLSNFDPPLVGTGVWIRESYFFAKKELFELNKFFSWLIKAFNAYPVDTEKMSISALKFTEKLLKKGIGVIFFPEGTRSKVGHFLEFNPGIGWLSLKCNVPVVPTLIKDTNTPLIKQFIRKNRVYIKFAPPIFPNKFGDKKEARYLITQEVAKEVNRLYESIKDT